MSAAVRGANAHQVLEQYIYLDLFSSAEVLIADI